MLTQEEKDDVKKILQRRSRFVWTDKKCESTISLLQQIRSGEIKLSEMLPGGFMSYNDYLYERDLLKFVENANKDDPAVTLE